MSVIHCSALSECISAIETFFVTSHKASSAQDHMRRTLCHYTFMHCVTAPTFRAHFYHEVPLKKDALIFLFSTKHWLYSKSNAAENKSFWLIIEGHTCSCVFSEKIPMFCSNFFSFLHIRCSFPQKLPTGVQEDPESSLQGVCACLHSSLWQHLQHGCRGPHQYLLQALLLLHIGVQPHWSLWTGTTGENTAWPQRCKRCSRMFSQRECCLHCSQSCQRGTKYQPWCHLESCCAQ